MQERLLMRKLLKSKIEDNKDINKLIDEFVKEQKISSKARLNDFLASLFLYINKNFDKIGKEELLKILESKLKSLKIEFDTMNLENIYTKLAVINSVGSAKVSFDKIDIEAIRTARDSFIWLEKDYSAKTQNKIKDSLEELFKGEIKRAELSSKLKESFEGIVKKDEEYFELVADNIISQTNNINRVNQALKYDVEYFKIVARIDDKTSDFCRAMNGKIIEAKHLKNQIKSILSAKSIEEKKAATLWSNKAVYGKLPENIGLPPYHGRCRSIVQPVWIDEEVRVDEESGKSYKIRNSGKDENYKLVHIDKTGVERKINDKTYDHSDTSRARYISQRDTVAALNSIVEIAPHRTEKNRTVAKSSNGYFMVFEADKVITIYKPKNIKDKDNLDGHFRKNAIIEKKEIIKWKNTKSIYQTHGLLSGLRMLIKKLNSIHI